MLYSWCYDMIVMILYLMEIVKDVIKMLAICKNVCRLCQKHLLLSGIWGDVV